MVKRRYGAQGREGQAQGQGRQEEGRERCAAKFTSSSSSSAQSKFRLSSLLNFQLQNMIILDTFNPSGLVLFESMGRSNSFVLYEISFVFA